MIICVKYHITGFLNIGTLYATNNISNSYYSWSNVLGFFLVKKYILWIMFQEE